MPEPLSIAELKANISTFLSIIENRYELNPLNISQFITPITNFLANIPLKPKGYFKYEEIYNVLSCAKLLEGYNNSTYLTSSLIQLLEHVLKEEVDHLMSDYKVIFLRNCHGSTIFGIPSLSINTCSGTIANPISPLITAQNSGKEISSYRNIINQSWVEIYHLLDEKTIASLSFAILLSFICYDAVQACFIEKDASTKNIDTQQKKNFGFFNKISIGVDNLLSFCTDCYP